MILINTSDIYLISLLTQNPNELLQNFTLLWCGGILFENGFDSMGPISCQYDEIPTMSQYDLCLQNSLLHKTIPNNLNSPLHFAAWIPLINYTTYIDNKAKGRIWKRVLQENKVCQRKKCSFFVTFGVLCFPVTSVLRFAFCLITDD